MYHEVEEGGVLSVGHVKRFLVTGFPHADLQDILGVDSDYDENRQVGTAQSCKRMYKKIIF